MSNVPEGAQLSEDGQWWWDGSAWQPVEGQTGGGGGGGGSDGGTGAAAFDFDGGVRIDAENSPVPSANEPLKAAFSVWNVGTAAGACVVTFYIDGSDSGVTWNSPTIEPNTNAVPDGDGYAHGLPAQSEGRHEFEAVASPPGPAGGRSGVNGVDIGSAS